jgi:hypothetical protein
MRKRIDMIGMKINHWTVLDKTERRSQDGILYWKCRCDCGLEREVKGSSLRSGRVKQCNFNCPIILEKNRNEIFDKKYIEAKNGCWIWTGHKIKGGYGQIGYGGELVHRFSYTRFKGKIPEGMCVCHSCDNPACVNPEHLWLGTTQENNQDKIDKGRQIRGEKIGTSKLKEFQIKEIIEKLSNGEKIIKIANDYNVSKGSILHIKNKRSWTHI